MNPIKETVREGKTIKLPKPEKPTAKPADKKQSARGLAAEKED